ncbi:MAG TPA: ornithine cyclodeaminase family protein [Dehalococcoidia bacterium]|nr:ornithine cyclodeaminase family protein [Dehalococcoidia bacterium]
MRYLNRRTIQSLVDVDQTIDLIVQAFAAHARGETVMPAKVYLPVPQGDFRAMPALVGRAAGVKWVNMHPRNPERFKLPSVMALIVVNDPITGEPLAILEGALITALRTAAASALATRLLARPDADRLGIFGCGAQAPHQIRAISRVRSLREILVHDRDPARAVALRNDLTEFPIYIVPPPDVAAAPIVTTLTPSTDPYVEDDWILPGTHINALGADAEGKEELNPAILRRARIFIDDWEQATHSGEVNVPLAQGVITEADIVGTLGGVAIGQIAGRISPDDITIFDSTGLAVQDIVLADHIWRLAEEQGLGTVLE